MGGGKKSGLFLEGLTPAAESRHHIACAYALKLKLLGNTLCMQDSGSFLTRNCLSNSFYTQFGALFSSVGEIYGLAPILFG